MDVREEGMGEMDDKKTIKYLLLANGLQSFLIGLYLLVQTIYGG
jgi:hypothetical protein